MTERKYNRILWCDLTPNGWSVCFETPNGALFNRLYIGYSKTEAMRRARTERPWDDNIVNQPPPRPRRNRR